MKPLEIFVSVPLDRVVLHENPTPRPEEEVLELAKDIGQRGMIHQPSARVKCVTVRDWKLANYDEASFLEDLAKGDIEVEIGPGQTRFMAAQKLGWKEITVKLVEMDDKQFLELMVSENLKRHDMHPMDVSDYFKKCVDRKEGIRKIATRHGFGEAYVKKMLKLQDLGTVARDWFRKKAMTLEQAVALANTTPEFQEAILAKYVSETPAGFIFLPSPVKVLYDYHESLVQVKNFDWDPEDAELLPEAGPCSTCPKRSDAEGSVLKLWLGDDTSNQYRGQKCLDKTCMATKARLHQDRMVAALKAKFPNHEDVGYLGSKWELERLDDVEARKTITLKGEYWDRMEDKDGPCEGKIVIGRPHPIASASDHANGKVWAYCTDLNCKVHPRYTGGSGSGRAEVSIKGIVKADPLPSSEERRKLAKRELEASGKAITLAMENTLADCIGGGRREQLQGVHQAQLPEPLFWEIFKAVANNLEMATDKVLRKVAVENGFDIMGKTGSSWYNGLAQTIYGNEEEKAEQLRPWRDWLHQWQEWYFKAVVTAHKHSCGEKTLSEWAKLIWGVDHQRYFEAAMQEQNQKLEKRRNEVLALETKDAVLLENVRRVLTGPADALYQEEGMELLLKAISTEGLGALTSVDLKTLIKYLGGTAKRGAETADLETEATRCIEVWKIRLEAADQKAKIDQVIDSGGHEKCPNCDARFSVQEILDQNCERCKWPNNERPWAEIEAEQEAAEEKAEADEILADGGVAKCHKCEKALTNAEIIDQWCDDCNDHAAPDEDDVDSEEEE